MVILKEHLSQEGWSMRLFHTVTLSLIMNKSLSDINGKVSVKWYFHENVQLNSAMLQNDLFLWNYDKLLFPYTFELICISNKFDFYIS